MHSVYAESSCAFELLTKAGWETEEGGSRSDLITLPSVGQQILSDTVRFCDSKCTRVWVCF